MKLKLKGKKTASAYPSKTTINLAMEEKNMNSPTRALPIFLVVLALIAVFAKFAVVDRFALVLEAQNEVSAMESEKASLNDYLKDYEKVKKEYSKYSSDWMNENEQQLVDRLQVFALMDGKILNRASASDISMVDNVLSMNLMGISLSEASVIVTDLKADPMVKDVTVYTAGNLDTQSTRVSMTIQLRSGQEQQAEKRGGAEGKEGSGAVVDDEEGGAEE